MGNEQSVKNEHSRRRDDRLRQDADALEQSDSSGMMALTLN